MADCELLARAEREEQERAFLLTAIGDSPVIMHADCGAYAPVETLMDAVGFWQEHACPLDQQAH